MKFILNTRPREQQAELSVLLEKAGFSVVEFPVSQLELQVDEATFCSLERECRPGDFLVLTSPRGAEAMIPALCPVFRANVLPKLRVAVIGEQTQAAVEQAGVSVEFAFRARDSRDFAEKLLPLIEGRQVFLFQGNDADPALAEELESAAERVFRESVYRMNDVTPTPESWQSFSDALEKGLLYAIVYGSSDAVRRSVRLIREIGGESLVDRLRKIPVAAIGRKTKATAEEFGFEVAWMPTHPSFPALVQQLETHS